MVLKKKGKSIVKYTIETLRAINGSYVSEHSIWPSDVEKVNDLSARLEAERQGAPVPTDGDIVVCAVPGGEVVSDRGHLQKREIRRSSCACILPPPLFTQGWVAAQAAVPNFARAKKSLHMWESNSSISVHGVTQGHVGTAP